MTDPQEQKNEFVWRSIKLGSALWDRILAEGARRHSARNYTEAIELLLADVLADTETKASQDDP